jgi:anaerobic magnesium-protoporphyrin IX monomethyl ester cyclase
VTTYNYFFCTALKLQTMKVLLINPFYPISETPSPPLGLAYLAAALEQAGAAVKILDYVVYAYRKDKLQSVLKDFRPQIAGATAVTMTFDHAKQVLKDIKTIDPDILTVMGGPHVSFCAPQILKTFPELDVIVLGEGEETLVDLVRTVEEAQNLDTVGGIVYRMGSEIKTTVKRKFIENLDRLPLPARHLLALGRYRTLGMPISMTTSRGCPYKCIFCVGRKMVGAKVRYHSARRVVTELEYLANLNFRQINIADDLFTADQERCLAVCDEMIKKQLQINWTSFARVDTVSEALLVKMKAAGCTAVSFGIESANPDILKTVKKGITLQQVRHAVRMCRRAQIIPHASFILGLPGETPATIKESIDFAAHLQQEGLSSGFHILAPFPGTEVREKSKELGLRILTSDWSKYDANRAVIETAAVNHHMLNEIALDWENKYIQYLGLIQQRMQAGTANADEVNQLENLERTVILYELMMNDTIEENGSWSNSDGDIHQTMRLNMLLDRIEQKRKIDPHKLESALRHAIANGNLNCNAGDGKIEWQWQDFLSPET